MKTFIASLIATAVSAQTCPNFHSVVRDAKWIDLTKGRNAFNIASHVLSDDVWITFHKEDASGNGYHIGKWSHSASKWVETPDQPVGADYGFDSLTVDRDGDPAYVGFKNKHILFMKQGMWTEVGGCSHGVAYGPNEVLYRRGCDQYVYRYQEDKAQWVKLGNRKALALTASASGVWITDKVTMNPYKWNRRAKKFELMGKIKVADIAVGLQGQVIVRNWANNFIYRKEGLSWKLLDKNPVISFGIGKQGRLFKRMEKGNQILMQSADRDTEQNIKNCAFNVPDNKGPLKCGTKADKLFKQLFQGQEERRGLEQKLRDVAVQTQSQRRQIENLRQINKTLKQRGTQQSEEEEPRPRQQNQFQASNEVDIETEKRISSIMNMNKMLTTQIQQKSDALKQEQSKMNRLRSKTKDQNAEIQRLTLENQTRTKQNEKQLTIAQRKVIANQYKKLNDCANTLFQTRSNSDRAQASYKRQAASQRSVSCDDSEKVAELTRAKDECEQTLQFDTMGQKDAISSIQKGQVDCERSNLTVQNKLNDCKAVSENIMKSLQQCNRNGASQGSGSGSNTCKKEKRLQTFYKYKYSKCAKNLKAARLELEQATEEFASQLQGTGM